jgi:hypothetical protein
MEGTIQPHGTISGLCGATLPFQGHALATPQNPARRAARLLCGRGQGHRKAVINQFESATQVSEKINSVANFSAPQRILIALCSSRRNNKAILGEPAQCVFWRPAGKGIVAGSSLVVPWINQQK